MNATIHNYFSPFAITTAEDVKNAIRDTFREIKEFDSEVFSRKGVWLANSGLYAFITEDTLGEPALYVGTNEGEGTPLVRPAAELEKRWKAYFRSEEYPVHFNNFLESDGVDAEEECRRLFLYENENLDFTVTDFCDCEALFQELRAKAEEAGY